MAPARPDRLQVLGSAFDNAPVGIAVLASCGVVVLCNRALGAVLDRDPAALVGTALSDLTHPDDLPAARRAAELLSSGASHVSRHECRFLRRDGTALWVSVNTAQVPDSTGRPDHLIAHVEDITDRKSVEAALLHHALHDALEQCLKPVDDRGGVVPSRSS